MLEITKIVAALIGGGAVGALLTEWFRRRRGKVRAIPLIERVNRLLSPELQGITLARIVGTPENRQLEELRNLREYQLTLRNTSSVHFKDAEVQFEFPADDVQAWASRPTLSKTTLLEVASNATAPWKKAFRWRIPHLPSGDSVEFTFQAVDPSSDKYEASLYESEGIVLKRTIGELPIEARLSAPVWLSFALSLLAGISSAYVMSDLWHQKNMEKQSDGIFWDQVTTLELVGCKIEVTSLASRVDDDWWRIAYLLQNRGDKTCAIQWEKVSSEKISLDSGREWHTAKIVRTRPRVGRVTISVFSEGNTFATTLVQGYVESSDGVKGDLLPSDHLP